VPFTVVHTEKYKTEDKLKIQTVTKTKHNPEKSKQRKTQQKLPCTSLVASYDTLPGNKAGLFYNSPKPTWSQYTHV